MLADPIFDVLCVVCSGEGIKQGGKPEKKPIEVARQKHVKAFDSFYCFRLEFDL